MDIEARIADLDRRLANLMRPGLIFEVDHDAALCRVQIGKMLSDWLPWFERRAGETVTWCPPTVGEQVLLLAPSGELAAGFVLRGLYTDENTAPSSDAADHVTAYPDGAVIEYNHQTSTLKATGLKIAELQASESIKATTKVATLTASESATIDTATLTATASSAATLKSPTVTIDAQQTNVTGPMAVAGVVSCGGLATVGGASASFSGPVEMQGSAQIAGQIINAGVNLTAHTHIDSRGGNTGAPK